MVRSARVTHRPPAWAAALLGVLTLLAFPSSPAAQQAADFFKQNCTGCHTIGGGRLVGPDLKGVTTQQSREWLLKFLQDPKAMIDSGDPIAKKLQEEAHGMIMPTIPGMTPAREAELLDFLAARSQGQPSAAQAAAPTASEQPFTPQEVAAGQAIFRGTRPLAAGGPPCISCHSLGTLTGLGGGRLAPDLTRVYDRLGGRQGVQAWRGAPATPTMGSIFRTKPLRPEEITAILAVIEDAAAKKAPVTAGLSLPFFFLGVAGMLLGLAGAQAVWRNRFRGVRRPLVHGRERGER